MAASLKPYILMALTALLIISSANSSVPAPKAPNTYGPVPVNSMPQHMVPKAAPTHEIDSAAGGADGIPVEGFGCWPCCGGGGGFPIPGCGCGGGCQPQPKNPYYCQPVGNFGGNPSNGAGGFIIDVGDNFGASSDNEHKS